MVGAPTNIVTLCLRSGLGLPEVGGGRAHQGEPPDDALRDVVVRQHHKRACTRLLLSAFGQDTLKEGERLHFIGDIIVMGPHGRFGKRGCPAVY